MTSPVLTVQGPSVLSRLNINATAKYFNGLKFSSEESDSEGQMCRLLALNALLPVA